MSEIRKKFPLSSEVRLIENQNLFLNENKTGIVVLHNYSIPGYLHVLVNGKICLYRTNELEPVNG